MSKHTIRVFYVLFCTRGAFLHAASVVVCLVSALVCFGPSAEPDVALTSSNVALKAGHSLRHLDIRHQARKPRPAYVLQDLPTFVRGILANRWKMRMSGLFAISPNIRCGLRRKSSSVHDGPPFAHRVSGGRTPHSEVFDVSAASASRCSLGWIGILVGGLT
ncbi:hypothetical protein LXA43DRAFT_581356 [Ganoderma leucocontextum]|nr:hypothetical protein LXA43DRAFT_581356 [Ganoderma leucocontextum]